MPDLGVRFARIQTSNLQGFGFPLPLPDLLLDIPLLLAGLVLRQLLAVVRDRLVLQLLQLLVRPRPWTALEPRMKAVPAVPAAQPGAGAVAGALLQARIFRVCTGPAEDLPLPFSVGKLFASSAGIPYRPHRDGPILDGGEGE